VDEISVTEEKVVFIIEAKRTSVGQAMKQILLATKGANVELRRGIVSDDTRNYGSI